MKKQILMLASVAFIGTSMLFTSCKKDETAPVITLKGDSVQTVVLNAALVDPGATANDAKDGDLTSITSDYLTAVDKDKVGDYTVTYTVSDKANNVATKTRTVKVKNDAFAWEGTYTYHDDCSGVTTDCTGLTITASKTENNKVTFDKFACYTNAAVVATVSGTSITAAAQTLNVGTANESHTFTVSSGTLVGTGTTGSKINLSFSDKNNALPDPAVNCTSTYTKN